MAENKTACPKCQGAMEPGVIPDRSYGAILQGAWFEGQADKGLLGSLKLKGKRSFPVVTDRCASCGYLEFYARP